MKTKTGQKQAGFFVSKVLSFARAGRERERKLELEKMISSAYDLLTQLLSISDLQTFVA